jgi:hypothetical protein
MTPFYLTAPFLLYMAWILILIAICAGASITIAGYSSKEKFRQ